MQATQPDMKTLLQTEYQKRRLKNPSFSLRAMARFLELPPGTLSEILSGKRKVTPRTREQIFERLALGPEERSRIQESNQPKVVELSEDTFRLLADWYYYAILSLTETRTFKSDPAWIARRLGLTPLEVKAALDRLQRLGFITIKNKTIKRAVAPLRSSQDIISAALRISHRQNMEISMEKMDTVEIGLRDITSITMAIDPLRIPGAKQKIAKFRRELSRYLEAGVRTEVYNLSLQLIPFTKLEN